MDSPPEHGVIYTATSPHQSFFRLGCWTGDLPALEARCREYYADMQLRTWPCANCRVVELDLLAEFAQFCHGGSLFDKVCLASVTELLDLADVV